MDPLEPIVKTRTWEAVVKERNMKGAKFNDEGSRTPSTVNTDLETPETLQPNDTEGVLLTQFSQGLASMMPTRSQLLESGLSGLNDSLNTQSSNIPVMKNTVGTMVQPERMTQGDTQVPNFTQNPGSTSIPFAPNDPDECELPDQDVVRCQCGDEKKDDHMVSQSDASY